MRGKRDIGLALLLALAACGRSHSVVAVDRDTATQLGRIAGQTPGQVGSRPPQDTGPAYHAGERMRAASTEPPRQR